MVSSTVRGDLSKISLWVKFQVLGFRVWVLEVFLAGRGRGTFADHAGFSVKTTLTV